VVHLNIIDYNAGAWYLLEDCNFWHTVNREIFAAINVCKKIILLFHIYYFLQIDGCSDDKNHLKLIFFNGFIFYFRD
jgi:hypothetical protein